MDDMFAVVGIGLSVCIFLLILLGIGEFYGGSWNTIAQGVAPFILLVTVFALGCYVLVRWLNK